MTELWYLKCENVQVGFPDRPVAGPVDLTLPRGQILSIIDPNGAGKTTFLKSLARQLPLQGGTVLLDGKDLSGLDAKEQAKKMAILMTRGTDPGMITCRQVVAMGRHPYTGLFGTLSEEDEQIITNAMEYTEVADLKNREYGRISDGQRQRILLARALCQQPEILLLDEPTSFLDIRYKLEFLSLLRKLANTRDLTVILSLHEVDLAARVSDRIACLKDGRLDREGTPEEIYSGDYIDTLFDLPAGTYGSLRKEDLIRPLDEILP